MDSSIRILHVDDTRGSETETALERADAALDVTRATGMAEGLELLGEQSFDGIVSSYALPERNGLAFLEAVREEYPAVPFVLFTDEAEPFAGEAVAADVTDIRRKDLPNATELLAAQLRRLAGESSPRPAPSLAGLLDHFWNGFVTLDDDWQLTHVSESAADLLGQPAADLLGEDIRDLLPETTDTQLYDHCREAQMEGDPRMVEVCYDRWDRWFRQYIYPDEDGLAFVFRDITAQREREQVRERQIDALESAQEGISILDGQERFVYVNEAYAELYGYDPEEMLGEHWELIYRDEDVAEIREEILPTVEREGHWRGETTGLRADGGTFVEDHTLATTADGGLVCTVKDITYQKRVTRELREEREFVEQALDTLDDLFYVVGTDGTIRRWNARLPEVTGYSEDEIADMHVVEFFPEAEHERVADALEEVLTRGEALIESELQTADGDRIAYEFTGTQLTDAAGEVVGLVGIGRDITARKRREQELQRERDRFEQLVDGVSEYAIFMLDADGHISSWNAGAERIKGYSEEEALGEYYGMLWPSEAGDPERLLSEAAEHGTATDEGWRVRKDGTRFWANVTLTALYDDDGDGDVRGYTKVTRDMTDRKRYEDRIAGLNELLTEFVSAEDEGTICDLVTEATQGPLVLPATLIARLDDDQGSFRVVARTPDAAEHLQTERILDVEGPAWQAFTSDEQVVRELDGASPLCADAADIERLVAHPLGRHGVFLTGLGSTELGERTETTMDVIETVGESLRSALDRIERERLLREREQRLEQRTEQLGKINRLNDIIRTIDRELVDATDRAEIERRVCSELVSSGPYRFGWVGTHDARQDHIAIQAAAGNGDGYLDAIDTTVEGGDAGQEPALEAIRTGETQVVDTIRTEPPYEPWREAALKREFRAAIALPIVYRERLYGVLTLYTGGGELDELEQEVLTELGVNIAHAINAVEVRRALVSDMIVELELSMAVSEVPLLNTVGVDSEDTVGVDSEDTVGVDSEDTVGSDSEYTVGSDSEYTITLETMAPAEDGTYRVVFTAQGVTPSKLEATLQESPSVLECELISNQSGSGRSDAVPSGSGPSEGQPDSARVKCLFGDESFITWLFDHAAVPRSIQVTGRRGRISLHLPPEEDVREFVELLQSRYDGTELLARRNLEQSGQSRQALKAELEERFTPRQEEILRLAYESGYFESPREQTASELADVVDISQPTFTNHLRASQRKLLDLLYEDELGEMGHSANRPEGLDG